MNDKRAAMIERAQRFRRRMNGKDRAVSPVVATLILILIAVAAAAALYLWLVTWQGNITGGIGNVHAEPTLTIGGSTSVYPFDELAVTQFQQNNTDIAISNNQGGSGAGMIAVCSGAVDIGAASFPVTPATLVSSYGCSAAVESTVVVTTVAYDAVDVIVASANTHGLLSISYDTLALVYADGTYAAGSTPKLLAPSVDGQSFATVDASAAAPIPVAGAIDWNQIPAAVFGATVGTTTQGVAPVDNVAAACGAGAPSTVQCYAAGGTASASTCGFTVCATGPEAIVTVARSDASGTTQSFEARLLNAETSSTFATSTQLQGATTGFSGCGSSNYISDCGYVATTTGVGNPGVISAVATNPNAIGYASDGLARAAGSGVDYSIGFLGVGQSALSSGTGVSYGGITPTTGSSGTIALGIKSQTTAADYTIGYLGWRPFDLVTLNTPTATAAAFITFVTDPANNQNLASESQEVSVYSV